MSTVAVKYDIWLCKQLEDPWFEQNYEKFKKNSIDFYIGKCSSCEEIEVYFCSRIQDKHSCGRCGKQLNRIDPGEIEWQA